VLRRLLTIAAAERLWGRWVPWVPGVSAVRCRLPFQLGRARDADALIILDPGRRSSESILKYTRYFHVLYFHYTYCISLPIRTATSSTRHLGVPSQHQYVLEPRIYAHSNRSCTYCKLTRAYRMHARTYCNLASYCNPPQRTARWVV
jgi:hypothetical protein